jgi:hypothetical protein
MAKYRKKPVVIHAEQYLPNKSPLPTGVTDLPPVRKAELEAKNEFASGMKWIETLEGGHVVTPGDYVITGVKGERYPCKEDIFLATYELVEETA